MFNMSLNFQLKAAITKELLARKLQVTPIAMLKIIQLWETKLSRHSVMTVGGTQSGKTVAWRVLQSVMAKLHAEGEPGFQQVRVGNIHISWFRCLYSIKFME